MGGGIPIGAIKPARGWHEMWNGNSSADSASVCFPARGEAGQLDVTWYYSLLASTYCPPQRQSSFYFLKLPVRF